MVMGRGGVRGWRSCGDGEGRCEGVEVMCVCVYVCMYV